jgi:hypothetical protein
MGSAPTVFGLAVTGELLSVREGRSYQGRNGAVTPGEVALLVGDAVYVVRYPTVDAAMGATGGAPERSPLTLRVAPRLAGAKDATARAWVEYRGLNGTPDHAD